MTTTQLSPPDEAATPTEPRRELARWSGLEGGPTLVCVGSLHGNEPAGYWALERVVATLQAAARETDFNLACGSLVALTGNLGALVKGQRYLDHDLNRGWSPDRVEDLRGRAPLTAEENEGRELVECIDQARRAARGPLVLLDLHTTSGDSPPFVSVADRLSYRRFALRFQVPVILGMDDCLDGTLLEWIDRLGFLGIVFEGGRHDVPESIDHNEAAVWIALDQLGLLGGTAAHQHPILGAPLKEAPRTLKAASNGLPRMLEIRYRHELSEGTSFRMAPGFRSFQPIQAGTLLAYERGQEVCSHATGRLLMPLYQPQGDDGFFVMRSYGVLYRLTSWLARRSGMAHVLPLLPGIERACKSHQGESNSRAGSVDYLSVDQRWRRGLAHGMMRHFGYHALSSDAGRWLLRHRI